MDKKTMMFFGGQAKAPAQSPNREGGHAHPGPQAPKGTAPSGQPPAAPPHGYANRPVVQPPQIIHPPTHQPAPKQPYYQPGRVSGQPVPPAGYQPVAVAGQVPSQSGYHGAAPGGGHVPPQQYHGRGPQQPPPQQPPPGQPWGNQGGAAGFMGGGGPLGNMSKRKIIASVAGAIVVAIIAVVGLTLKNKFLGPKAGKHTIAYNRLGIDRKKANVDDAIVALERYARKWKKDASWFGVNVHDVRPDGTADLSKGGAVIKFVSPRGVSSAAKSVRKDSIKEYSFGPSGARSNKMIGAKKPWKDFQAFPVPECKVSDVVKTLNGRGFDSGTVRISFNPSFGFASGWNWRVFSDNQELAGYYSMDDCTYSKKPPG